MKDITIKQLRQELKMTGSQLAKELDTSYSRISLLERGLYGAIITDKDKAIVAEKYGYNLVPVDSYDKQLKAENKELAKANKILAEELAKLNIKFNSIDVVFDIVSECQRRIVPLNNELNYIMGLLNFCTEFLNKNGVLKDER